MTKAARLDFDPDLPRARLRNLTLDQLEGALGLETSTARILAMALLGCALN
jgi:hypothetical protein